MTAYRLTWRLPDGSRGHVDCIAGNALYALKLAPVDVRGASVQVRKM